jgi:D-alanine--D-alanine ligase
MRSGRAVADAASKDGHEVSEYDPMQGYAGLDDFVGKVDVVLPILHGKGGEDGEIQSELEARNFKYLGADSKVSALCANKVQLKEILNKSSITTPAGQVVDKESFSSSPLISRPYVLKPIDGGSTIDTFIVRDPTRPPDLSVFEKYEQMLIEELIEGTEITVPVLGDAALPVIEIIPPTGKEFDYENKYNGATQEICPPTNVSQDLQAEAKQLAEKVHKAAGVHHLSRTDIIIDKDSKLWVLEINTIPGLTSQSLFPKAAAQAGLTFEQLVDKFVQMAAAG